MHDITDLPAWERLFKKIVWKQLGDMATTEEYAQQNEQELRSRRCGLYPARSPSDLGFRPVLEVLNPDTLGFRKWRK